MCGILQGKVLVLGAGLVVGPGVEYLAKAGFDVTVASRTGARAEKLIEVSTTSTPTPHNPLQHCVLCADFQSCNSLCCASFDRMLRVLCPTHTLTSGPLLACISMARLPKHVHDQQHLLHYLQGLSNCTAVELDAADESQQAKLEELMAVTDIVVSLLPWTMHTYVILPGALAVLRLHPFCCCVNGDVLGASFPFAPPSPRLPIQQPPKSALSLCHEPGRLQAYRQTGCQAQDPFLVDLVHFRRDGNARC